MVAPYRLSLVTASDDRKQDQAGAGECLEEANQNAPRFLWQLLLSSPPHCRLPLLLQSTSKDWFSPRTADHVKHNEGDRKETTYFSQLY